MVGVLSIASPEWVVRALHHLPLLHDIHPPPLPVGGVQGVQHCPDVETILKRSKWGLSILLPLEHLS